MIEEVLLDRYILDQIEAYDIDLSDYDPDAFVPREQLSQEVLEML